MTGRTATRAGFTLVELMLAAVVVSMIGLATVMLVHSIATARAGVDQRLESDLGASAAAREIVTALRNAYRPVDGNDALFEGVPGREGEFPADRVRFRAVSRRTVRAGEAESDQREIEFFLAQPDPGEPPALMRRVDPTRNRPPDGGGVVERVAGSVISLEFEYLDNTRWTDRWPEGQRWPAAVRFRLVYLADPSRQRFGVIERLVNFPYWSSTSPAGAGGGEP